MMSAFPPRHLHVPFSLSDILVLHTSPAFPLISWTLYFITTSKKLSLTLLNKEQPLSMSFLPALVYLLSPSSTNSKFLEDGVTTCFVLSWIPFIAPDTEQALFHSFTGTFIQNSIHLWMNDWVAQESYLTFLYFFKVIVTLHITGGNSEMPILQT